MRLTITNFSEYVKHISVLHQISTTTKMRCSSQKLDCQVATNIACLVLCYHFFPGIDYQPDRENDICYVDLEVLEEFLKENNVTRNRRDGQTLHFITTPETYRLRMEHSPEMKLKLKNDILVTTKNTAMFYTDEVYQLPKEYEIKIDITAHGELFATVTKDSCVVGEDMYIRLTEQMISFVCKGHFGSIVYDFNTTDYKVTSRVKYTEYNSPQFSLCTLRAVSRLISDTDSITIYLPIGSRPTIFALYKKSYLLGLLHMKSVERKEGE